MLKQVQHDENGGQLPTPKKNAAIQLDTIQQPTKKARFRGPF
jgi:hypothetical protein